MLDILLIYPKLGSLDEVVKDIPISLIYAASDAVKNGFNVKIIDCRLYPNNWREKVDEHLKNGCRLVGLSVMTGNPITTSLEISRYIKEKYDDIPIVWGGPHPTILPEQTIDNEYIDYVIRDWGSKPLYQLISHIKDNSFKLEEIVGLAYKDDGKIYLNKLTDEFECIHYRDLPYHLVDIDSKKYNRLGTELHFPIFTSMGCPYKCTFCMAPAVYGKVKGKKWIASAPREVLDHIEFLLEHYEFTRLQIFDDDSFINLDRMRELFEGYIDRGFHKKLVVDFRGARINELYRMDDDLIKLMADANVEMLMIGAESGSDRVLKGMKKGITVEQTISVNKKFSRYPSLKPHFNIMCGVPGETYEDLVKTKELMETLANDNPHCLLGRAGHWKPLPGSAMTDKAVKEYGLKLPESLEEWAKVDSYETEIRHPWYTKKFNAYINLLQIAGLLLDKKIEMFEQDINSKIFKFVVVMAKAYRPLIKLRLKYNYSGFLFESHIKQFILRTVGKIFK